MKRVLALFTLLALGALADAQTTVTIPAQTACSTLPAQTVCVTLPARTLPVTAGTVTPPTCTAPQVLVNGVCTTPVTTPPPAGVTWMYLNGVKTLAGDFTGQNTSVNYNHTVTGNQFQGHTQDIQLTTSGAGVQWPYFLPYFAANYKLPNPGWTKLLLSLKPTVSGQVFGLHMERVGDQPLPAVELMAYGPASVAGVWGSYVIPLKDLGTLGDATLYKFLLQDHSATSAGFELDAIGLQ
jgi:hypothetical protein